MNTPERKAIGVITIAAIVGISCVSASGRKESPASSNPGSPSRQGRSVTSTYLETCAKCHGDRGQGGGGGTRSLLTEQKYDQGFDKHFFDAIKNGVPNAGMEAYGTTMTDEEIWGQVVHIRELQAQALRAKNGSPRAVAGVYNSKRAKFRLETVLDTDAGLETPWAIDWLPDGKMLVTNRPGFMVLAQGSNVIARVEGLPESREMGQGGLMEVAVHPDHAKNKWIYLAYTEPGKQNGGLTRIVRGKLQIEGESARWVQQQTIWEAPQQFYTRAGVHFGSRIVFDNKGHVFFIVGERGGNMLAQQLDNPFGKVYRLNEDGSEPRDNPFVGKTGSIKGIWSLGHRNPQGLVFDLNGALWVTEHGPRGGDEVNKIEKGANYGWPVVAHSINYNDSPFRTPWPRQGEKFTVPVFRWLPSIGACGLDVARGPAFPEWKGDLLAGGLSGANLDRLRIQNGVLVEREELLHGLGRVREVAVGPDGTVYVALNQPDKVIRLVPSK